MSSIFCNSCFESKEDSTRTFSCTSCSHVFCSTCLSNFENFCLICKVKCKVLEINEDLPAEVKLVFDETSFQKCIDSATRVYNFQENQTRMYTEKVKISVEKYQRVKKDILRMKKSKQDIINKIKLEKALMEKLKHAYRSGQITRDLFLLGSPNTSELLASQPDRAKIATSSSESVSSNSFFSSGAASQTMSLENSSGYGSKTSTSSTSFDSIPNRSNTRGSSAIRNSFGSSSRESQISDSQQIKSQLPRRFSNEEKVNRPFIPPSRTQTPTSQAISFSQVNSNRNIFMKTRQDLLENTLRHMQIVSQSNQQNNRKNK